MLNLKFVCLRLAISRVTADNEKNTTFNEAYSFFFSFSSVLTTHLT